MPAKPVIPSAGYDFSTFSANNPTTPQPGGSLDTELQTLRTSQQETLTWLGDLVSDSGGLKAATVTPTTLNAAALTLITTSWNPRGAWVTGTAYALNDHVVDVGGTDDGYVCVEAHTSGTFATDLAAGKWTLVGKSAVANGHTIEAASVARAQRGSLNFSAAFTVTDDAGNDRTTVAPTFGATAGVIAEGNHNHDGVYLPIGASPLLTPANQASSFTATAAHLGQMLRCTAAITVSPQAAATLGAGWHAYVRAEGGAVTIDPDGSETVDGNATLTFSNGETRLLVCDGTGFFTIGVDYGAGSANGKVNGQVLSVSSGVLAFAHQGWELVDYADLTNGGANDLASADLLLSGDADYMDILVIIGLSSSSAYFPQVRLRNSAGTWRSGASDYIQSNEVSATTGLNNQANAAFDLYNYTSPTAVPAATAFTSVVQLLAAGNPAKNTDIIHDGTTVSSSVCGRAYGSGRLVAAAEINDQVRVTVSAGLMDAGQAYTFKMRLPT